MNRRGISFDHDRWDRCCSILALAGIAALTVRRWALLGDYPPGLDGAQWIAFGRGFHGVGRSSVGAYAPLAPLMATMADSVFGTLAAVRLLATLSSLLLSLAVWFVARIATGSGWGLVAALLVIPASALAEPLMYGGYPQQFALATGIIAVTAASAYVVQPAYRRRNSEALLWVLGASSLLCASAHHIYFPLMLISVVTSVLLGLTDARNRAYWRTLLPLVCALLPAGALFVALGVTFVRAGYDAPLAASARSVASAWDYATRESPGLWVLLCGVGIVTLAASWHNRVSQAWIVSASLILPTGLFVMAFGQPRLAPPLLIGTALAVGFGVREATQRIPGIQSATIVALLAVSAFLLVRADNATTTFADFYQVADESLQNAAVAIDEDGAPGAIAVREDRRGWPIGWWLEALQERPVFTGSDPRWLAFPNERDRARQTAALFDGSLDATTFLGKAAETGTRYLVIPKWDWIGWDRWLSDADFPLTTIYDDDRILVLRVGEPSR